MTDSIANGGCCSGSVRPGTYGDSADVAQITVDKCGRITKISNVAITGGGGFVQPLANLVVSNSVTTTNLFVTGNIYANLSYLVNNSNYMRLLPDGSFTFPNNQIDVGSNSLTMKSQSAFTWDWNDGTGNLTEVNLGPGGVDFNVATPSLSSRWYFNPDGSASMPGNVYVANTVTATNVHVTDTLDVVGSMTANAANATFFFDTFTIPYINTQYLNVASNVTLSGNLSAPLANITTLNVNYLTVNSAVVYGISNLTNVVANTVSVSNTVFIGNTYWTGANSTISVVGPPTRLVFDNTTTPYAANKILLHSNTASANICGFGVTGLYNIAPITLSYYTSGGHSFSIGANQNFGGYEVFSISETGQFNFGGPSQQAKLLLGGSLGIPSNNTMMRIDSSNVALVTNGAGRVGFGTIAPTANLHVIGNVYVSNALTTTNVFTSNIVYSLDVLAQGPYLNPSTANASVITQWYSRLVNTTSRPFWSVSATPQFSYINTSNISGYVAQTLLNDGRVLFNQINGTNIGFFYPQTNQFSYVSGVSINGNDYSGVLQIPDGRVVFVPCNGNKVGLLNPSNYTFSTVSTGTALNSMHLGAVYEPTGNVIMTPSNSSNVGIFNTNTGTYSRVSFASEVALNTTIYFGSVLLPDGRVVFIPNGTSNVGIYTPSTATYSNVTVTVNGKYAGGCLMPDGNVFMVPNLASSNACIYNPNLNLVSNVTTNGSGIGGGGNAAGAVSLPDGRIVITPANNNSGGGFIIYNYKTGSYTAISGLPGGIMYQNIPILGGGTLLPDGRIIITTGYGAGLLNFRTPAPLEFCLHPFFNKF